MATGTSYFLALLELEFLGVLGMEEGTLAELELYPISFL